ncbi:RepB plasmid partition protein [Neoasaia chiangmaiensis NBRC 101099]|uniref:Chromosome partitioning protein ParB n=1 Tax=Neoasaia chiangmaiensis TaxID=320497 RepID=A0A1U9KTG8_9PROT|nr:plasmid partitioning protein RepB C-terminal domain-containing protein [Neoasaia chiangmaiensis]AQS89146.1 chromosome partitioning protein ParB [Neoasaia chiangmaiensis]GBR37120.1 RepB plasmid partition protein [Neoasaia chiangmaiensis NBRC 101099]GEN16500.1 chromosome partitioning protein ParB [Neoasaia chiangmaiensis]
MTAPRSKVRMAFERASIRIPISEIGLLRDVSPAIRKSKKYGQIAATITEVGLIEPPVVARDGRNPNRYHLLDGYLRIDILKERGQQEAVCLVALDDEGFTYNKKISRLATIQEHRMILKAIKKGVSEERLARALNVNINSIRHKRTLVEGICPEAVDLLKDRHVPIATFAELKRLKPIRQIEAAMAMNAMSKYSVSYAKSIVAATRKDLLVQPRQKQVRGLAEAQIATMEHESATLDREFKIIEKDYGQDHLILILAVGYIRALLSNARVVRYLAQYHPVVLPEFQKVEAFQAAA